MVKRISLLGATGSIGRQTLDVAAACGIEVAAVTAFHSVKELEEQARAFRPELAVCVDPISAKDLKIRLADTGVRVASGTEGLLEAAALPSADCVVSAVVGIAGLEPTLAAVRAGKRVALANKETMVCAGELVMDEAERCGAQIVPVDSEHSAIFQCLQGNRNRDQVKRLILTASGGPFYGRSRRQLEEVGAEQALKHPNWSMGAKVTIDSATLMNKGLEFIEAMRLFRMPPEKISIVVHRESIVHSLVEYSDGAVLAQLGAPDMRLPIQYSLTWPDRCPGPAAPLDLLSCPPLTFAPPDMETFSCLRLALEAAQRGGTAPAILNGANETAVEKFLAGEIRFLDIQSLVERALCEVQAVSAPGLREILEADHMARESVLSVFR